MLSVLLQIYEGLQFLVILASLGVLVINYTGFELEKAQKVIDEAEVQEGKAQKVDTDETEGPGQVAENDIGITSAVFTLFDHPIPDPFSWLENLRSNKTLSFIKEQVRYAIHYTQLYTL